MAVWIPLRQPPGLGTILNAILIGIVIDVTLPLLPATDALGSRALLVLAGIGTIAVGSGLYLTSYLGPGPRDGLMTALHRRTGRSLRLWRTVIESGALIAGFLLGGVVGVGTVAYALLIGPGVQAAVCAAGGADRPLGWEEVSRPRAPGACVARPRRRAGPRRGGGERGHPRARRGRREARPRPPHPPRVAPDRPTAHVRFEKRHEPAHREPARPARPPPRRASRARG